MKKKSKTIAEKGIEATNGLKSFSHSKRELYKSILSVIPPLKDKKGDWNEESINLALKAIEIFNSLKVISRKWSFSIHWLYTVCNPNITKIDNVKFSPIYQEYSTDFPNDHFGELARVDDDPNGLIIHQNKLVADSRFVDANIWDFGSAWDDDGNVIKFDATGHPKYDGFSKSILLRITAIQNYFNSKQHLDRNFYAFLIAHTRDFQSIDRNGGVEHKGSHFHGVLDLPRPQSRYQVMRALGSNFDDFTDTFNWLHDTQLNKMNDRVESFLNSLRGMINNFNVPDHYDAALKYLVHQSSGAKKDQKTPYDVNEVISWIPNNSTEDYSKIAGVFNNEIVAKDLNQEVINNLNSPYNKAHHTSQWVGGEQDNKVFSYKKLIQLRMLGKKNSGKLEFSVHSQKLIIDLIISWIRSKKIEIVDVKILIHAAFNDDDADSLLSNKNFVSKMDAILENEKEAIISDADYDRQMLTIFVSASTGGIGKTRLATELAKEFDKGRMPHMAATKDEGKTFDAYQNYANERSSIIDEVDPNSFSWSQLKDLLDPHKVPGIASRFVNQSSWNVHHTFLTNVYRDGVSGYVKQVLRYAPGVGKLGYLEKINDEWRLKENDASAKFSYLSQLSQLLRRIPIEVRLEPHGNKSTKITVSIINFKPGGSYIHKYDYVHTEDSEHVFDSVINENISKKDMRNIILTIKKMIEGIQLKADRVFQNNPSITLDDLKGFTASGYDMGIKYRGNHMYLSN